MLYPKTRSNSSVSDRSTSSLSSFTSTDTSSSRAEDMMERLLTQDNNTNVHLWSAGNLRIEARDLTMTADDIADLLAALRSDKRFELVNFVHLGDGDEWKASYRLVWSSSTHSETDLS